MFTRSHGVAAYVPADGQWQRRRRNLQQRCGIFQGAAPGSPRVYVSRSAYGGLHVFAHDRARRGDVAATGLIERVVSHADWAALQASGAVYAVEAGMRHGQQTYGVLAAPAAPHLFGLIDDTTGCGLPANVRIVKPPRVVAGAVIKAVVTARTVDVGAVFRFPRGYGDCAHARKIAAEVREAGAATAAAAAAARLGGGWAACAACQRKKRTTFVARHFLMCSRHRQCRRMPRQ